jgi:ribosome-binding ATPase
MGFNCGIVGLPNVGKSTLFNALTQTASAQAANYPFCTIEPNVGRVNVPDPRLLELAKLASSKEILYTQLEFVDIAGLVKGASKGEGLGNKFLSHIRQVDAIVQVLRCFENGDITHVEGSVDPIRDMEIIETELVLADMESVEKRFTGLEKRIRGQDKEAIKELDLLKRILPLLEQGKPARLVELKDASEAKLLRQLQLMTAKPIMYVCNVAEDETVKGNHHTQMVEKRAKAEGASCLLVSAKIEEEVALLENEEEKKEFLETLGLSETGLSRIVRAGYKLLDLITFFTIGPKEAHAWTLRKGALAPQAAGVIHTDFEKGFIRSETIGYQDYIAGKGEQGAKDAGKMRLEGKEYVVQDGDILHFRFNV